MGTPQRSEQTTLEGLIALAKEQPHQIDFRIGEAKFSITTPLLPELFSEKKNAKTCTLQDALDLTELVCKQWNANAAVGRIVSVMDTAIKNALIAQVKSSGEITLEALQIASDSYSPLEGQVGLSYDEKVAKHITKCVQEDVDKGLFESLADYEGKKDVWKVRYEGICMKRKDAPKMPKPVNPVPKTTEEPSPTN